jgi:hypothetical protein
MSHRKPAQPAFDPRTVKERIVETPLNEEMSKSFPTRVTDSSPCSDESYIRWAR